MIACPECGRPLEPFEITSGGRTWTHHPNCWHPEIEEIYGKEMTVADAIELAEGTRDYLADQLAEYTELVQELKEMT